MQNKKYSCVTAPIFSDHMVVQRDKSVPVWGTGLPGTRITVKLHQAQVSGVVAADGTWKVWLPAQPAGGPYCMQIATSQREWEYHHVYIGEVWLAAGQSNMELPLQDSTGGEEEVRTCTCPHIHVYATPKVSSTGEILEQAEANVQWYTVAPDTAADMSAVSYYFSKTLLEKFPDLHIGIVQCYWGGTSAACWMPPEQLNKTHVGRQCVETFQKRCQELTPEEYGEALADYRGRIRVWEETMTRLETERPELTRAQRLQEAGDYPWPPPPGPDSFQCPGTLYRTMVSRVKGYGVRGVLYYQAEEDNDLGDGYYELLSSLIHQWRKDWMDWNLPFLLVQLPMYGPEGEALQWPALRNAQWRAARMLSHVGIISMADAGEQTDIHPKDKRTPGTRLAALALDMVYKTGQPGQSPQAIQVEYHPHQVVVTWEYCQEGLELTGTQGFEVAGEDGVFYEAIPAVDGTKLYLNCQQVEAPCYARYAWYNYGPAPLYRKAGYAAIPFETRYGFIV